MKKQKTIKNLMFLGGIMLLTAFTSCSKKESNSTPNAPFEEGVVMNGSVWSVDSVQVYLTGPTNKTVVAHVYVDNGNPNQVVYVSLRLNQVLTNTGENVLDSGNVMNVSNITHSGTQKVEMQVYIDDLVNDANDTRYEPKWSLCQKEIVEGFDVRFMFDIDNQTMFFEKFDTYELCVPNSYSPPEEVAPLTMTNFKVDSEFRLFE